ncbi:unnamed protein product [Linum tenue]|uniref:Uncharacterized protein n=1 Tax=Linum tenue TaxID=586396 RepID=A0AAV0P1T9_9ROSI|nr:unnamed protein product [Linum tenue]
MSRRNSSNGADRHHQDGGASNTTRYGSNRNYVPKTQKKFVPKQQSPNPSTPTLSDSLRRSASSTQSDAAAPSSSSGAAPSSIGTQTGKFVNYLPQDEAVAAGLGAEKGGLDAVESQRVVDLLNRELARLLKRSPREFWKEGNC